MERIPGFNAEDANMQQHRKNVRNEEGRMREIHEARKADRKSSANLHEVFSLSDPFSLLLANGPEVLKLDKDEADDLYEIGRKMLRDELSPEDEERLAGWLNRYDEEMARRAAH